MIAWIGQCSKQAVPGQNLCREHGNLKCVECGEQACRDCEMAAQLVCGAPLCDKCDHSKHGEGARRHGTD